jgi:DNA topoisomerase IA
MAEETTTPSSSDNKNDDTGRGRGRGGRGGRGRGRGRGRGGRGRSGGRSNSADDDGTNDNNINKTEPPREEPPTQQDPIDQNNPQQPKRTNQKKNKNKAKAPETKKGKVTEQDPPKENNTEAKPEAKSGGKKAKNNPKGKKDGNQIQTKQVNGNKNNNDKKPSSQKQPSSTTPLDPSVPPYQPPLDPSVPSFQPQQTSDIDYANGKKDELKQEKQPNNNKSSHDKKSSSQKQPASSTKPLAPSVPPYQPQQTSDLSYAKGKKVEKQTQMKQAKQPNNNKNNSHDKKPSSQKQPASTTPLAPSVPPNQPQQTNDLNYANGEAITVLHVGEKPSIAQAIAQGLAKGSIDYRSKILPVHEFTDPAFPNAPKASRCHHRVTSVAGHVFSVDFPPQFQSWESVDPAELFHAPVIRKPCKGSIVKHLQDEARGVNFIVLWMDCDREGENINFEVLECCMHLMKGGGSSSNYDRVYRAFFSAINPTDIVKAYNALGKPDKNQSLAVDARQELDLKVGVAFSRFQTRFFQGRYADLDSGVLSYGPCQTPTLGFCVQRHIDIETFKPEPYWVLELNILKRGSKMRALWASGRSFKKSKVENLKTLALETNPVAQVTSVVTKEKKQGRPIPLNTVALLKACSKALGIGPHAAMQTAERLYLSGYLSYPRTESSAYPQSFDIAETLQQQVGDARWSSYVRALLREGHNKSRGGVDMGDHPPITPCRAAGQGELSGDMARVYEFVVRHFIASVSQDAVWRCTRVDFAVEALGDKGSFILRGKQLVTPGFLVVLLHKEYGDDADSGREEGDEDEEERAIPEFTKGEVMRLINAPSTSTSTKVAVSSGQPARATLDVKEKITTPPSHLTESELIGLMEKNGIGTDASIATHIENIQKRNYVNLASGRRLLPSRLGLVLVQGYHQIDSSLVLPRVRSDIEDQCNMIAKGLASREEVVKRVSSKCTHHDAM